MRALVITLTLLSVSSFALANRESGEQEFRVRAEILVKGKVVAAPTFTVRSGELGRITQGSPDSNSYLDLKVTPAIVGNDKTTEKIALETALHYKSGEVKRDLATRVVVDPNLNELTSLNPTSLPKDFEVKVGAERL